MIVSPPVIPVSQTEPNPEANPPENLDTDLEAELTLPDDPNELRVHAAKIGERYKSSSTEAKRLHQQSLDNQARITALEQQLAKSTTPPAPTPSAPERPAALPSIDAIMKVKVDAGMDEKVARHSAEVELALMGQNQALVTRLKALENQLRFSMEDAAATAIAGNAQFKEANDFFADFPEMAGATPAEKLQRYQTIKGKMTPAAPTRDTSAARASAGSPSGNGSNSAPQGNQELEAAAKEAGYKSAAQMDELAQCNTAAKHAAYKKKWGVR